MADSGYPISITCHDDARVSLRLSDEGGHFVIESLNMSPEKVAHIASILGHDDPGPYMAASKVRRPTVQRILESLDGRLLHIDGNIHAPFDVHEAMTWLYFTQRLRWKQFRRLITKYPNIINEYPYLIIDPHTSFSRSSTADKDYDVKRRILIRFLPEELCDIIVDMTGEGRFKPASGFYTDQNIYEHMSPYDVYAVNHLAFVHWVADFMRLARPYLVKE